MQTRCRDRVTRRARAPMITTFVLIGFTDCALLLAASVGNNSVTLACAPPADADHPFNSGETPRTSSHSLRQPPPNLCPACAHPPPASASSASIASSFPTRRAGSTVRVISPRCKPSVTRCLAGLRSSEWFDGWAHRASAASAMKGCREQLCATESRVFNPSGVPAASGNGGVVRDCNASSPNRSICRSGEQCDFDQTHPHVIAHHQRTCCP